MAANRLSPTAKRIIMVGVVLGALIVIYSLRSILPPFAIAIVVAYVLNPAVEAAMRITRRSRTTIVVLLYLALVILLVATMLLIIPTLIRQVQAINIDLEAISAQIRHLLTTYQSIEIGGVVIDLQALSGEIRSAIQSSVSFLASRTGVIVVSILSGLVWGILVLFVSFYLLKDAPRMQEFMHNTMPETYRSDFRRILGEINDVLNSYLRGQVVLGVVIGVVTGVCLAILGVRNALLLGILAGVLEVIPNIGPVIASIPAIASALFQGSTYLPIEKPWFALLVTGLYLVIQQVENNVLVPRIIGGSVKLHPVVVIFGALAGASVAGVLGVLLAIPVITIARIFTVYVYQKLSE